MPEVYPLAPLRTLADVRSEADRLLALPTFPEALKTYTRSLASYREANSPFAKLISNEDRYRVLNYLFTVWA